MKSYLTQKTYLVVITDINKITDTDANGFTTLPTYEAVQDDSDSDVLAEDEQTEDDDVSANVRNFKLCWFDM